MERVTPGSEPYVLASRGIIVLFAVAFVVLVRVAWQRNGYDDRAGFAEAATAARQLAEEGR
jgi:hypothetical protein